MTRIAEFSYRVIRLQGKSQKASMQLISIFKVDVRNFEDVPYVQISILIHFREGITYILPAKNYGACL